MKDAYPLPRTGDCLYSLCCAKYFSTLDCNVGFWKMPIEKRDQHKTALTCRVGMFQFKRMPFGLCTAPATFQRALDILLAGYLSRTCVVYLDDVIVFSATFEDHVRDVQDVLTIIRDAGLSLKLKKCEFF